MTNEKENHKPNFDRKYISGLMQDMSCMTIAVESTIEDVKFKSYPLKEKDRILTQYYVEFTYLAERISHTLLNLIAELDNESK